MQPPPKLTPREQEILPFLTSGANRNEIANHFGLSAETVKRHTRNILAKFGAKTLRDGMWDITDYLNNYGLPDPLYPLFAHKVIAEHVYDVDTRTMTVTHAHAFQCMADKYKKTEIAVLEDDFVVNSVFIDGQEIFPSGHEVGKKNMRSHIRKPRSKAIILIVNMW